MRQIIPDFPKVHCPFIRKNVPLNKEAWKKEGFKYQLRKPTAYLVTPEVAPGYEWVLEDPKTFAVEKLDGSNVSIKTEGGRLTGLQNRKNVIDPLQIMTGKSFILEGVFNAVGKGYVKKDSIEYGELLGPKLQGNPYKLPQHIWFPFERAKETLRLKSFEKHDRSFDNFSSWFKDYLISFFYMKTKGLTYEEARRMGVMAEGVVFYNPDYGMAKLRRNMFDWYYPEDFFKV